MPITQYTKAEWQKRIESRMDFSAQVTHLTRPTKEIDALDILIKILRERTLIGSTVYIIGDTPAVCFFDAPLYSICENVQFEKERNEKFGFTKIRYDLFGLTFTKPYIFQKGGRPVIYDKSFEAKEYLPPNQWWRIVNYDLSDPNNFLDWSHEREWRIPRKFTFDLGETAVVVPGPKAFWEFFMRSAKGGEDVSKKIKCVIPFGSFFL